MSGALIAELLEAAIEDEEVECEAVVSAHEVGKALGKLLTRQQQGESWLGILYRKVSGRAEWRFVPADPKSRDEHVETALVQKLAAALHKYACISTLAPVSSPVDPLSARISISCNCPLLPCSRPSPTAAQTHPSSWPLNPNRRRGCRRRYCHPSSSPRMSDMAIDFTAEAQTLVNSVKGSLTSIADLVQALAAASVPLAGSQLGLPLLLTAAMDEIGVAQFDLQSAMGVPQAVGAKRRPDGDATRNSPAPAQRHAPRAAVDPVAATDAAIARQLPEFVSALLRGALQLLLGRTGTAVGVRAAFLRAETARVVTIMSKQMTLQSQRIVYLEREARKHCVAEQRRQDVLFVQVISRHFRDIANDVASSTTFDADALHAELARECPLSLRKWRTAVTANREEKGAWWHKLQKALFFIDGISRIARPGGPSASLDNHPLALLYASFLEKHGAKRSALKCVAATSLIPYPDIVDRRHDRRLALRREAYAGSLELGGHAERMAHARRWLPPLAAITEEENDGMDGIQCDGGPRASGAAPTRRPPKSARTAAVGNGKARATQSTARGGETDDEDIQPRDIDFGDVRGATADSGPSHQHSAAPTTLPTDDKRLISLVEFFVDNGNGAAVAPCYSLTRIRPSTESHSSIC